MSDIVQKDTKEGKVLRQIAKEVPEEKITSKKIQDILFKMHEALASQADGVALAAPQIGISLRVFVVSPKVFRDNPENTELVFINPVITKRSRDKKLLEEGCLSVRPWYGKIRRNSRVTLVAYRENGDKFEVKASGFLAQIFQHETDHLDGILFVDNATNLIELQDKVGKENLRKRREKDHEQK